MVPLVYQRDGLTWGSESKVSYIFQVSLVGLVRVIRRGKGSVQFLCDKMIHVIPSLHPSPRS